MTFSVHGETEVFFRPSSQMNLDLAKQSALLCDVSYQPDFIRARLLSMCFEADTIEFRDYQTDALHSAAMAMARKTVTGSDGRTCTVYVVVVRGTSTGQEMISNFIVGDGDISAGFQQAAERAYGHWQEYLAKYPPENGGEYKVWITGHSRGAAVANLLAGEYMPRSAEKENIYGYTFATPNVQKTVDAQAPVFNFLIDGDVVTRVPPAEWGFRRHGTDIHYEKASVGEYEISSKNDTDRLIRTIIEGGLSQSQYLETMEPMLIALFDHAEKEGMNYTAFLLPLLQNVEQSTAEDKMNLSEIMAYMQRILPSHTMTTYRAWLDMME